MIDLHYNNKFLILKIYRNRLALLKLIIKFKRLALWTYTPLLHLWTYTPPPLDVCANPMGHIGHTSYIICTSLYVET